MQTRSVFPMRGFGGGGPLLLPAAPLSARCRISAAQGRRNSVAVTATTAGTHVLAGRAIAERILRQHRRTVDAPIEVEKPCELGYGTNLESVYELRRDESLGAGAFGKVCSAVHRQSGANVAVKTLSKVRGKLSRGQTLGKISREIAVHEAVQGTPGAVRLLGVFEDAQNVHMVQERCHGGDLRRLVESSGPLPECLVRRVAGEVVSALRSFHASGVIYADCKPANFCLVSTDAFGSIGAVDANGCGDISAVGRGLSTIRIVDFGCSQQLVPGGELHVTKRTGTLAYMAPEVFDKHMVPQSDMWSLGITLYFAFAGRLPFWAPDAQPRLSRIEQMADIAKNMPIALNYGPWVGMSPEGHDFMERCLKRDPLQRMTPEQALAHPWLTGCAAS